ncbi:MIT domain-containing protein [Abeliophyllum distichum]|uniref:MIT domain-containing protein n=1 Tax=Abeliophyllum distichum TaxID=126358 RepID=A0ABD1PQ76_9LAMI
MECYQLKSVQEGGGGFVIASTIEYNLRVVVVSLMRAQLHRGGASAIKQERHEQGPDDVVSVEEDLGGNDERKAAMSRNRVERFSLMPTEGFLGEEDTGEGLSSELKIDGSQGQALAGGCRRARVSNGDAAVATRPKTKPKDGNDGEDVDKEKLRSGLNSAIIREKPNIKWNDVAGLESAKQLLPEAVILPDHLLDFP